MGYSVTVGHDHAKTSEKHSQTPASLVFIKEVFSQRDDAVQIQKLDLFKILSCL